MKLLEGQDSVANQIYAWPIAKAKGVQLRQWQSVSRSYQNSSDIYFYIVTKTNQSYQATSGLVDKTLRKLQTSN